MVGNSHSYPQPSTLYSLNHKPLTHVKTQGWQVVELAEVDVALSVSKTIGPSIYHRGHMTVLNGQFKVPKVHFNGFKKVL